MRIIVSDEVRSFVDANGGVLYVSPHRRQCCSGSLTVLDATTRTPADVSAYRRVGSGDLAVRYRTGGSTEPDELVVEMKGVRRKRPVAYWNGCAFKI